MAIDGKALTAVGIGAIFIWSGVKGWSVLKTIEDIIRGGPPAGGLSNPLVSGDAGDLVKAGAEGVRLPGIASVAPVEGVRWLGHPYRFGGAPGQDGSGPWDCSSFCNFIYGVKLGLPIPGYAAGQYHGQVHGPTTFQWAVWPGIRSITRDQVQAGDVIVYQKDASGHMGIAINNTDMVHAPNPRVGTIISKINGESKPIIKMGRYQ